MTNTGKTIVLPKEYSIGANLPTHQQVFLHLAKNYPFERLFHRNKKLAKPTYTHPRDWGNYDRTGSLNRAALKNTSLWIVILKS